MYKTLKDYMLFIPTNWSHTH